MESRKYVIYDEKSLKFVVGWRLRDTAGFTLRKPSVSLSVLVENVITFSQYQDAQQVATILNDKLGTQLVVILSNNSLN